MCFRLRWARVAPTSLATVMIWATVSRGLVTSGVDTISVSGRGFDLSNPANPLDDPTGVDLAFVQRQDLNASWAGPARLTSPTGIADLGEKHPEEVAVIPNNLSPDLATADYNGRGERIGWSVNALSGHVYAVWTVEGNFAKVLVRHVITFPEAHPANEAFRADPEYWSRWYTAIILEWYYQDNGTRVFDAATQTLATTWGKLKSDVR